MEHTEQMQQTPGSQTPAEILATDGDGPEKANKPCCCCAPGNPQAELVQEPPSVAVASFITMSFVGSTTYTSLSGVRREMRIAVPLQTVAAVAGIVAWIVGRFV